MDKLKNRLRFMFIRCERAFPEVELFSNIFASSEAYKSFCRDKAWLPQNSTRSTSSTSETRVCGRGSPCGQYQRIYRHEALPRSRTMESVRKDIECLFGRLKIRWGVLDKLMLFHAFGRTLSQSGRRKIVNLSLWPSESFSESNASLTIVCDCVPIS